MLELIINYIPGQSFILQISFLIGCPSQEFPPLADSCTIDLSRDLEPAPQVIEQDVHILHADHLQST